MSPAGSLPSATEIARALGGRIRPDGCIAYPGPGRRPKDRSCTLKLDPNAPSGFIVSDARKEIDDLTLKDDARLRIGLEPFTYRRSNGNGHHPAGPNGVRDLSVKDGRNREGEVAKTKRLHLLPFNAIRLTTKRRDLVKGLVPRIGLTVVYGPPKSGKSFLTFDLAAHVALGRNYRGRRVDQNAAVYCYFEGQSAASARIEGFRQRHLTCRPM